MSRFITPLITENIDGRQIRIVRPFTFLTSAGDWLTIPEGFLCDGQSYPRLLWMIDTPVGKGGRAGVVHDYLYWLNGRVFPGVGKAFDREASDKIFREALLVSGLNAYSAGIRYWALRAFGWVAWNAHTARIQKEIENNQLAYLP